MSRLLLSLHLEGKCQTEILECSNQRNSESNIALKLSNLAFVGKGATYYTGTSTAVIRVSDLITLIVVSHSET